MTQHDALRTRARPGRRAVGLATAAMLALTIGACDTEKQGATAPANPAPSTSTSTTSSATAGSGKVSSDGIEYAVAPPLGTESTLPRSGPAGLETIDPTASRHKAADVFGPGATKPDPLVAAVFLEAVGGGAYADATSFRPGVRA